jgi:GcrA cell cycle regulator
MLTGLRRARPIVVAGHARPARVAISVAEATAVELERKPVACGWLGPPARAATARPSVSQPSFGTVRGQWTAAIDTQAQEQRMQRSSSDFVWNDGTIQRLRSLWAEGHSTAEIGRRLGVSKNTVVGKAHRLDLPSRPSPIGRTGASVPRATPRPPMPRLADIVPMTTSVALPAGQEPQPSRCPKPAASAPVRPATNSPTTPAPIRPGRVGDNPRDCNWPIGEPGTRGFRFCGASAQIGKPYCDEHARLAYRPACRRGDDDRAAVAD